MLGPRSLDEIHDGGPIYWETQRHFDDPHAGPIIEPCNATSALLFIVMALYWSAQAWRDVGHAARRFMLTSMLVLLVGGVGGTAYHALRSSSLYLLADWLPIVLLCLAASVWFMQQLGLRGARLWLVFGGSLAGLFAAMSALFSFGVAQELAIAVGYASLALIIAGPMAVHVVRHRFANVGWMLGAIAAMAVALLCRTVDARGLLPMGTHFLWHGFGALAANLAIVYVWRAGAAGEQP